MLALTAVNPRIVQRSPETVIWTETVLDLAAHAGSYITQRCLGGRGVSNVAGEWHKERTSRGEVARAAQHSGPRSAWHPHDGSRQS
jgi:hypothetical protein